MAVKKQKKSDKDISSKAKVSLWGSNVGEVIQYENGRIGFRMGKPYHVVRYHPTA